MKSKNLAWVKTAHQTLFNERQFANLDQYFSQDFIEHSPYVKGNLNGLIDLVKECAHLKYTLVRALADGDYVVLHGQYENLLENILVGFDIYQVVDGKIIAHWDNLVAQMPANVSGNTQLDGPTEVDQTQHSDNNRKIVVSFFEKVLMQQQYDSIPELTNGDDFQQHSPDIGNTADAMRDFLIQLKDSGTPLVYHKIHRVIADGQFVLTHSEGEIDGKRTAYCELWRVDDNGKVAELWDAISEIPLDSEAVHSNGLF